MKTAPEFTDFPVIGFPLDDNVWSAVINRYCKEKAEGEKTSLRKCIRPLVEPSAPGQDELRAYLSLLVGRLSSTNSSNGVSRHAVVTVLSSLLFLLQTSVGKLQAVAM